MGINPGRTAISSMKHSTAKVLAAGPAAPPAGQERQLGHPGDGLPVGDVVADGAPRHAEVVPQPRRWRRKGSATLPLACSRTTFRCGRRPLGWPAGCGASAAARAVAEVLARLQTRCTAGQRRERRAASTAALVSPCAQARAQIGWLTTTASGFSPTPSHIAAPLRPWSSVDAAAPSHIGHGRQRR
jgi:hypothetical protein